MPGDLARPCYELVGTRDSVRNVVAQLVERVDLRECREIAVRWLPEGVSTTIPPVYLHFSRSHPSK